MIEWIFGFILYFLIMKYLYLFGRYLLNMRHKSREDVNSSDNKSPQSKNSPKIKEETTFSGRQGSNKQERNLKSQEEKVPIEEITKGSSKIIGDEESFDSLEEIKYQDEYQTTTSSDQLVPLSEDFSEKNEESMKTVIIEDESPSVETPKEKSYSSDDLEEEIPFSSSDDTPYQPSIIKRKTQSGRNRFEKSSGKKQSRIITDFFYPSDCDQPNLTEILSEGDANQGENKIVVSRKNKKKEKVSFHFKLPGTNHELVRVNQPDEHEIEKFNQNFSNVIQKFTSQVTNMMEPMLDVMEVQHPEMAESIQDIREIIDEASDEDENGSELDNLPENERIHEILSRSEKEEKSDKVSEARKSQKKLSKDASSNRLMEKIHLLRNNILTNAAEKQTDPEKKKRILSLNRTCVDLAEGFSNGLFSLLDGLETAPFMIKDEDLEEENLEEDLEKDNLEEDLEKDNLEDIDKIDDQDSSPKTNSTFETDSTSESGERNFLKSSSPKIPENLENNSTNQFGNI